MERPFKQSDAAECVQNLIKFHDNWINKAKILDIDKIEDLNILARELFNGFDNIARPYFPDQVFNVPDDYEVKPLKGSEFHKNAMLDFDLSQEKFFYRVIMIWIGLIVSSGKEQGLLTQELCKNDNINKLFPNSDLALIAVDHWQFMLCFGNTLPFVFDKQVNADHINALEQLCDPQFQLFLKTLAKKAKESFRKFDTSECIIISDDFRGIPQCITISDDFRVVCYDKSGKHLKFIGSCFVAIYHCILSIMSTGKSKLDFLSFAGRYFEDFREFVYLILGMHPGSWTILNYPQHSNMSQPSSTTDLDFCYFASCDSTMLNFMCKKAFYDAMRCISNDLDDKQFEQINEIFGAVFDNKKTLENYEKELMNEETLDFSRRYSLEFLETQASLDDAQQFRHILQIYILVSCLSSSRGEVLDNNNIRNIKQYLDLSNDKVPPDLKKKYFKFQKNLAKWEKKSKDANPEVDQKSQTVDNAQSLILSVSLQEVVPTQGVAKH